MRNTHKILFLFALVTVSLATKMEDMAYEDDVKPHNEEVEEHQCALNEVWMDCPSCEHKCGEKPPICPRICQTARCHCPAHKGFQRNSSGDCVKQC